MGMYVEKRKGKSAWPRVMRMIIMMMVWIGIAVAFRWMPGVHAAPKSDVQQTFLVRFDPQLSHTHRLHLLADANIPVERWLSPIHVARVRMPARTARRLAAQPGVQWLEEDNASVRGAYTPSDPAFQNGDHIYAPEMINLPRAWDWATGDSSVIIAVVDSGVDPRHVELRTQLMPGWDFANNDGDPTDDQGHGTHVAGTIAAAMDNGNGSAGVCPDCRILPIKVLDENNQASWSTVIEGLLYAVDQGAHVINLSLGGAQESLALAEAIEYARAHNVLVVAAAGNAGSNDPFYPAALDGVLAVGATDQQDAQWSLSNTGDYLDVVAPGYRIFSTVANGDGESDAYGYMTGTSMAAPHVAGLAGLLLSHDATRSFAELSRAITSSTVDLGEPGWDPVFGHGRIDAYAALSRWMDSGISTDDSSEVFPIAPGDVRLYVPIAARS